HDSRQTPMSTPDPLDHELSVRFTDERGTLRNVAASQGYTPNEPLSRTEPSGSLGNRSSATGDAVVETQDVVATVDGVVVGATSGNVLVKLLPSDVVVHFPRELFLEDDMSSYGTPLVYEVVRAPNGIRSQRFRRGEPQSNTEAVAEIAALLDDIKYR